MDVLSHIPLLLGIVICVAVCAQTGAWFTSFVRQWRQQTQVNNQRQQLLSEQIAIARAQRLRMETMRYSWQGFRKFVIHSKVTESEGVASLYLVPQDRRPLPEYEAGQFVTLRVRRPEESKPLVRCYSLSDRPRPEFYRLSIKRITRESGNTSSEGKVSSLVHDSLSNGDVVELQSPKGDFVVDPASTRPLILMAAGIGITPIYAIASELTHQQSKRNVILIQGFRNSQEHPFRESVSELTEQNPQLKVVTCYSKPASGDRRGEHYDVAGRISFDLLESLLPALNYEFYVCGPSNFMDEIVAELRGAGVPDHLMHFEGFGTPPSNSNSNESNHTETATVNFKRSDVQVQWDEDGGTLLDLAQANGVEIESSCRQGSCGTCLTRLLGGSVEYDEEPSFELRGNECLPCAARPKGEVDLDA